MRDPFTDFVGFQWDAGNSSKNLHTHEVTMAEAEQAFLNRPVVVSIAPFRGESEPRFALLGMSNAGRKLFVIFTPRDNLIRVISARPMSRRERSIHEQVKQAQAKDGPQVSK